MRLTLKNLTMVAAALVASAALCFGGTAALADNYTPVKLSPAVTLFAVADATANYTNATVTPSDIAAATVTLPKTTRPLTGNTSYGSAGNATALRICYFADAGKATATTGTITVLVNGVSAAAASRQINFSAGRGAVSACFITARPVATSLVVKLQGVSGDTNVLTVYNAELTVEELAFN